MTYVISYNTKLVHKKDGRHCIYLDSMTESHWIGINSWGEHDKYPKIPFKGCDVRIHQITVDYLRDSSGKIPDIELYEIKRPIIFKSKQFI